MVVEKLNDVYRQDLVKGPRQVRQPLETAEMQFHDAIGDGIGMSRLGLSKHCCGMIDGFNMPVVELGYDRSERNARPAADLKHLVLWLDIEQVDRPSVSNPVGWAERHDGARHFPE